MIKVANNLLPSNTQADDRLDFIQEEDDSYASRTDRI